MSDPFRKAYAQLIRDFRPDALDDPGEIAKVATLHDAMWRVEWVIGNRSAGHEGLSPVSRNKLRALNSLATDDYLFRTANPYRLLQALYQHKGDCSSEVRSAIDDLTRASNSIDDHRLRLMYAPKQWLRALEVARRSGEKEHTIHIPGNHTFKLNADDLESLGPLIFSPDEVRAVGLMETPLYAFHLISLKPANPLNLDVDEVTKKYELGSEVVARRSLLLGRYDALVVGEFSHTLERKKTDLDDLPPSAGDLGGANGLKRNFATVSRIKRLVPLGTSQIESTGDIAAVLISLKWDGSRLSFARWLQLQVARYAITAHAYLSDGWEDAVVLFPMDAKVSIQEWIGHTVEFVERLNRSPLVAGTETLFPAAVVKHQTELKFRFVCARGTCTLRTLTETIAKELADQGCLVENLAGAKDVQVLVEDPARVSATYSALHQLAREAAFRVETRVSWPLRHKRLVTVS